MTTWTRADAYLIPTLAYLTAGASRPDFDLLDLDELAHLQERLALTSGRSVARLEGSDGCADFAFLDAVLPRPDHSPDLDAALERWAAREDEEADQ